MNSFPFKLYVTIGLGAYLTTALCGIGNETSNELPTQKQVLESILFQTLYRS